MSLSMNPHIHLLSLHLSKKNILVFVDFIKYLAPRETYNKFYHKQNEKKKKKNWREVRVLIRIFFGANISA